jgi:hypothetical protein
VILFELLNRYPFYASMDDSQLSPLYLLMSGEADQVFTEFLRFARIQRVAAVNNT